MLPFLFFLPASYTCSSPAPGILPADIPYSGGGTCLCLCGRRSTRPGSSGVCSPAGGDRLAQQLGIPGTAELAQGTVNDFGICFRPGQGQSSPFGLKSAQMGPGARPQPWRAQPLTLQGCCPGAYPTAVLVWDMEYISNTQNFPYSYRHQLSSG